MAIKKFRPTTPSRRNMTMSDFAEITTDKPLKSLLRSTKRIQVEEIIKVK